MRWAPASPTTRRFIPSCRRSCDSIWARSRCCPTCRPGAAPRRKDLGYVLDHLGELVVKEAHGSGGYGMLIGPHARKRRARRSRAKLKADPEELHRPADAGAVHLPDLRRDGHRAAPCRSAAFVLAARKSASCPAGSRAWRWRGLAGRQFEPGRRHQGHLGSGETRAGGLRAERQVSESDAQPHRR